MQITTELVGKIDSILARGLCSGVGSRDGQMCIEAAICCALNLPHGDDPKCVAESVRSFKIHLNDCEWSSPEARAKGLRNIGIAQLGSNGVVDDVKFATILAEKVIRRVIPKLFRDHFKDEAMLAAADRCEAEGTSDAARAARAASDAARAASDAASYAARAASDAARAASYAARAARAASYAASDSFLIAVADCGLEVLRELKSPGCEFI